ncbi:MULTISPECIES: hypothetical protein [Streptomyces]|uniref:hypothetical protein n=1 Tax=Streptomyces TaxID=1883 RepID=UPI001966AAAB|nr:MULTISPECIES: hypothetical protein [Streptomyces]QRX89688.1 hypothetical protein JNO44_01345 [Streptomyces noursei]UJB39702.1 hypothetical protein HRD51_01235 [Streptomyces sp. A1-5]
MRHHFRILTVSAMLTVLTFGCAALAQAEGSGEKPRLKSVLTNVPVVGHVVDGLDEEGN